MQLYQKVQGQGAAAPVGSHKLAEQDVQAVSPAFVVLEPLVCIERQCGEAFVVYHEPQGDHQLVSMTKEFRHEQCTQCSGCSLVSLVCIQNVELQLSYGRTLSQAVLHSSTGLLC